MTYDQLKRLHRGAQLISFQQFDHALATTVSATPAYSKAMWTRFQADPIGYIVSRNPSSQGEFLFLLALEMGA